MTVTVRCWEKDYRYPRGKTYRVKGGGDVMATLEVLDDERRIIATHRNWESVTRDEPIVVPAASSSDSPAVDARAEYVAAHADADPRPGVEGGSGG